MGPSAELTTIYSRPAELLQRLIRFDTTNPPGNEAACIGFIAELLAAAGVQTTLLGRTPERPNLIARLRGRGDAPPLLLYGHVDVVTTERQQWQRPPFAGEIADGMVWGRGSLDMKGGVAMMVAAFLRAQVEQAPLPGDVILAVVADEEAGGEFGSKYLVEHHADHFSGVRHALGEFGGFSMALGGRRFYPIMVAEKQICWLRATATGQGGHGSMPVRDGALARLGRFLARLDGRRLPVHVTPVARDMVRQMASSVGGLTGLLLRQLTNPVLADRVLDALGPRLRTFDPLLHNTVSPTILHASDKVNVIPTEAWVELDGRLLPGCAPGDLLRELQPLAGDEIKLEVLRHDPGPAAPDMGLFETLAGILRAADGEGIPLPLLLSGVTDARFFSRLGIQTYGFTPMRLPPSFDFARTIHTADERVPVDAIGFGAEAIYQALQRFGA